jgi:hypothetical protein
LAAHWAWIDRLAHRPGEANAPAAKVVPAKAGKKAAKRNPDQREMLLPIAGTGKGK